MMDMHCHIDLYENPIIVIDKARKQGMYVLSVTTTPSAWCGTSSLVDGVPRFNTALGLHPQLANEREIELPLFDKLIDKTRYIGEIGLDGSVMCRPFFDAQLRIFRHILSRCQQYSDKILTIHSRGAVKDVLDELENHRNSGTPILHWYLGTKKELIRAVELGCWFSVGPAMLKSKHGLKVIGWIPKDRLLLETDGPFTTNDDGTPLQPVDYTRVVRYLGELWECSDTSVRHQLLANLKSLVEK